MPYLRCVGQLEGDEGLVVKEEVVPHFHYLRQIE